VLKEESGSAFTKAVSRNHREQRAGTVLERIGSDEARELLDALASGAAGSRVTIEAQAAVRRLTR